VGGNHFGTEPTRISNNSPNKSGIVGASSGGAGVVGFSENGVGVFGQVNSGVGLLGEAVHSGHALRTKGRIKVGQVSGVATIKKGKRTVTVTPGVPINSSSFVLLTPMTNIGSRGLWFTKKVTVNRFVIQMSSTRGGPTKVAWLALERG
jgi:hypothetical protein